MREFISTLLGQALASALLFALFVGPFLFMRFDHAAYLAGALLLAGVLLIYWPRRTRRRAGASARKNTE